jgi:hypothetical protein
MLGPLGSNATDRLADRPPARSLVAGVFRGTLTLPFRGATELISELQGGQRLVATAGQAGNGLAATVLRHSEGERLWV